MTIPNALLNTATWSGDTLRLARVAMVLNDTRDVLEMAAEAGRTVQLKLGFLTPPEWATVERRNAFQLILRLTDGRTMDQDVDAMRTWTASLDARSVRIPTADRATLSPWTLEQAAVDMVLERATTAMAMAAEVGAPEQRVATQQAEAAIAMARRQAAIEQQAGTGPPTVVTERQLAEATMFYRNGLGEAHRVPSPPAPPPTVAPALLARRRRKITRLG
jgi:hypothetical protein